VFVKESFREGCENQRLIVVVESEAIVGTYKIYRIEKKAGLKNPAFGK